MTEQELTTSLPGSIADEGSLPQEARDPQPVLSLADFWAKFRLSPNPKEHLILTSSIRLGISATVPVSLSILIAFLGVLVTTRGNLGQLSSGIFSDLSDPVFVYLYLALFLGSMIYRFRWYPSIRPAFQSLLGNHVLKNANGEDVSDRDYVQFLEEYRKKLYSTQRYLIPASLGGLFLIASLIITTLRSFWNQAGSMDGTSRILFYLSLLPRWFIGPLGWAFLGGLMLWTIYATTSTVHGLTTHFPINVQPLHSDKAGGLKRLGDLCSNVGLMVLVVTIPAVYLAVQGMIAGSFRTDCAKDFAPVAAGLASDLTQPRLQECIYYALGGFNSSVNREIVNGWVETDLKAGLSIGGSAKKFLDANPYIFSPGQILAQTSIYYAMLVASLGMLGFAFAIVVRPLWDIHESMLGFQRQREQEINNRVSSLFDELSELIRLDRLDEADKIRTKIKFLSDELDDVEKYPQWPIRTRFVLRSYVSSGVLTALVTYIVSLLKFSVSPSFMDIILQAIKTLGGGG